MPDGSGCAMLPGMDTIRCPDCAVPLPAVGTQSCPNCRLPLTGPAAQELWQVDLALHRVTANLTWLTGRRATLLHWLQVERAQPAPAAYQAAGPQPVPAPRQDPRSSAPDGEVQPPAVTWDLSRFAVRNLLLALGAALLGIAAVIFTIVSWGQLTLLARAAILLALTAVTLTAPWPLVRRGLSAT